MNNDTSKDSLLESLSIITKLYNKPFSTQSLSAGLPLEPDRSTPRLFSKKNTNAKSLFFRAAKKAGFNSKLTHYTLEEISPIYLPIILLLKGDEDKEKACILTQFSADKKYAKIIIPELGDSQNWIEIETLKEEYLNLAFLIKPEYQNEDVHNHILKHEKHHWFWGTLKHSKSVYIDVIIASFLINLFVVASPIFTLNIYDRVVPNNAIDTMWVFVSGIVLVYLFDMALKFLRSYFLESAAKKGDIIMSSMIFERVMNVKLSLKPNSVGSFANNLKEFSSIRNFFTASSVAAFVDLPFSIIFLFVIYYIGGSLVVIPLLSAFLIILYSFIVEKPIRRSIESTHQSSAIKNGILIEVLSALETIKSLGIYGQSQWKFEEASGDIAQKELKSKLLSNSIGIVVGFIVQLNTVLLIIGGVYAIGEQNLSMGGLIASVMLSSRMLAPLSQVASLIASFEQTKTAYHSVNNIMNLDVEREEGKKFVQRVDFDGKIEFKNVTFIYPNTTKKVLDNVSFTINPKESVGILGSNGSGKTTIEKLILGLYEPTEGSILIDGIDIAQLDPSDLRQNISYLAQDIVLFKGTLKDNIVVKKPNATDDEILEVTKKSGLENFVNTHPSGFDMQIGERGDGLSGGQKQLISIARSLLVPSPILLMDEPTSSMDSTNEANFIAMMQTQTKERTTILISHKNNLLSLVQRVIVFSNGKIIIDDKHENVLKKTTPTRK